MATPLIPIIVDTREQRPWAFNPARFSVERGTVNPGDYTVRGYENRISIERKSLGDFVGTVTQDWLRFRKKLWRLAGYDIAAIVVEANVEDVIAKRYESDATPASILGRANAITLDHGIPVLWWGEKTTCLVMVESFFTLAVAKIEGFP